MPPKSTVTINIELEQNPTFELELAVKVSNEQAVLDIPFGSRPDQKNRKGRQNSKRKTVNF